MVYENKEALAENIRHWMRFDHLRADIGLAILLGVLPEESNIDLLRGFTRPSSYYELETREYCAFTGLEMLDGSKIGLCGWPDNLEEQCRLAETRFKELSEHFFLFGQYWKSGLHPERTPLSYYLAWADTKKLPDKFGIRSAATALDSSASYFEKRGATVISAEEISGPTFERLKKAIAAFPTKYPEYKTNPPKLGDDVRKWLCESKLAENQRDEAKVFSNIIAEHFQFSTDSRKTK